MLIVRNYALAAVFITPTALTIVSGGRPVSDVGGLLFARGTTPCRLRAGARRLPGDRASRKPLQVSEAVARVVDAVAATSHHLALGAVTTVVARAPAVISNPGHRDDGRLLKTASQARRGSVDPPNNFGQRSRPLKNCLSNLESCGPQSGSAGGGGMQRRLNAVRARRCGPLCRGPQRVGGSNP